MPPNARGADCEKGRLLRIEGRSFRSRSRKGGVSGGRSLFVRDGEEEDEINGWYGELASGMAYSFATLLRRLFIPWPPLPPLPPPPPV